MASINFIVTIMVATLASTSLSGKHRSLCRYVYTEYVLHGSCTIAASYYTTTFCNVLILLNQLRFAPVREM